MHTACHSEDGLHWYFAYLEFPECIVLFHASLTAHNVPSAWNTLSPLLLLADAYSPIRTELKDSASWKTSPSAPPDPHPQPPSAH